MEMKQFSSPFCSKKHKFPFQQNVKDSFKKRMLNSVIIRQSSDGHMLYLFIPQTHAYRDINTKRPADSP